MGSLIAELKTQSRLALHRAMAVSAVYTDDNWPDGVAVTVRLHNRLSRNGSQPGGWDSEVLEGIDRVVFNETNLSTEATSVLTGEPVVLVPVTAGEVIIPEYQDARFSLDSREPSDGPESQYWSVSRERDRP